MQYRPQNTKTFPRWNYKRAKWEEFSRLTDTYTKSVKTEDQNINRLADSFSRAILKAASATIPRGARKNYRPYWTEELQELEEQVEEARQMAEASSTVENNVALNCMCISNKVPDFVTNPCSRMYCDVL